MAGSFMKRLILFLHLLVLLHMPVFVHAEPREDYEEAYKLYIAASTSVAAYNDRIGELATRYLEQDGWTIDYFVQAEDQSGARFLLANKESALGKHTYVMAIVGTETTKDIKMDLKVDKVYFAGSSLAEFKANAAKTNVPSTEPKVHKGFYEFIHAGSVATLSSDKQTTFSLPDILRDNPDSKIYITGHSLGGAAATLTGAWLISMGISPEQIEVITFGAPAVGNAAFAAKFEPTLKLTRVVISGDPVTGVLQVLIGGYKQFGQEIKWPKSTTVRDPHKLPGYVDFALKNYYDKRQLAIDSGLKLPENVAVKGPNADRVYIAPLTDNLPPELSPELFYMREALLDEYRQHLPAFVIGSRAAGDNWREAAIAAGCRWVIVPKVSGLRIKDKKNVFYISLTQTVYDAAAGAVLDTATFATNTSNLTPLEAFIHTFKGINTEQLSRLVQTGQQQQAADSN